MNLFRDYTFSWPQAALFKVYLFSAGLLVGAYFSEVVTEWFLVIAAVFASLFLYFTYQLLAGRL